MKYRNLLIMVILAALIAGCNSQRKIVNRYYLLEIPERPKSVSEKNIRSLDGFCEISPVEVYPAFSSPKIAIKRNSREIQYYTYNYWAQRPGESFTFILEDYFTHIPVFQGVSTRYWRLNPTYNLLTTVYNLEIIEEDDRISAHLALEFRLTDYSRKAMLIMHRADRTKELESKDLDLFAKVIGEMFYEEMVAFSDKVVQVPIMKNE